MKKLIYLILLIVAYTATTMAQVEEGVWYRIKYVESGSYMSAENYDAHPDGYAGGVKCVDYAADDDQIFTFIPDGENYKAKSKSGYYIYCQAWNVDALANKSTPLAFEATDGGYYIKNMTTYTYFAVSDMQYNESMDMPLPAGDGYYPFGNQPIGNAATFIFESVEIVPERTITVSSNNPDWGTVSGGGTDKDEITITAKANVGYVFVSWTLNDSIVSTTPTYVDMTAGDKHYVAIFEPLQQIEEGKWYRIKDVASQTYMSTENYDAHQWGAAGGVKCVEYAESDNQIFTFIPEGANYIAKSKSGYYIYCQSYNVDALIDKSTPLAFDATEGGYYIKNMKYSPNYITYFGVAELDYSAGELPAGDGYYPFGNQPIDNAATFIFESVEIVPLRTITVESSNPNWGTVSGGGTDKDDITITASANAGYKFISWTLDGEVVSTTPTYVDMTAGDKHYVAIFEPLLQLEVGKWYRIKDIASQTYLSAENYDAHPEGSAGGVKSVEYADVANQIFTLEAEGDNYKLKCISGYYVYCQAWNVDALNEHYTPISFEATAGGYYIKNMRDNTYFKVGYIQYNEEWMTTPLPAGDGYYAFGDGGYGDPHNSIFNFESVDVATLRTITVESNNTEWGTVTGGTIADRAIIIEATPTYGYKLVNWSVDGEPVGKTLTYVDYTSGDKHYVANFDVRLIYDVNVESENHEEGLVEATQTGGVMEDEVVTFTANPRYGYRFVNWKANGEVVSTKNPYTLTITEPVELVATFKKISGMMHIEEGEWYRIRDIETGTYMSAESYEAHTDGPGGGVKCVDYAADDDQIFKFEKDGDYWRTISRSGYSIYCQKWNIDAQKDQYTPLQFIATTNDACFIKNTTKGTYFKVEYIINYYWELIPLPAGEGYYPFGDSNPDVGMPISKFALESAEAAPSRKITVSANDDEWGKVTGTKADGTTIVGEGVITIEGVGDITMEATPSEDYRFVNWTLNDSIVSTKPIYIDHTAGNKHYVANFEKLPEIVSVEVGKKYRIRDLNTGLYLSTENYEAHPAGEGGGVKCVEYADSDNQIFIFEVDNNNYYKLKSELGYYIYCQKSNVDALSYQYTPLTLKETLGGYYICDMNDLKYFRVEYLASHTWDEFPPPAGDGYYPFGDAQIGDTHTAIWVLEPVETTPERTISASVNVAEGGRVTINGRKNVSILTADDHIVLQAIENVGYKFVSWTLNDSIVSTTPTYVDMTEGNKHYIANIQPFSAVKLVRTTAGEARVGIKTDASATITVGGEVYSSVQANMAVEVIIPETSADDIVIETIGANIFGVDCGANVVPVVIPETIKEMALRNVDAEEIKIPSHIKKLILVSSVDNKAVRVSPKSNISEGIKLVVEKEINTPQPVEGMGTPTIYNLISVPFEFNIANIKYWDGNSWEYATPETQIRLLLYDSQRRANRNYKNTWRILKSTDNINIPANQGFVVIGNNDLGTSLKLQFISAENGYDGTEEMVTVYRYRNDSGNTSIYDQDWNFTGVPYLTNGEFTESYTLYAYNNIDREWTEYPPILGLPTLLPYTSIMYQAEMGELQSKEIYIAPASVARNTNASEDIFARAYISIDYTTPAKIILSDESSESFVINEDAWYIEPLNNTTASAYFNIGGADAKVSVQPSASELPMTVYTGAGTQHRITLTATDGNYDVYLKDAVTNDVVCLNDEDYNFTAAAKTTIANRFTVSMVEPTGIIDAARAEGAIKAVVTANGIKLFGTEEGDQISLYNANGMVMTNATAEDGVTTIATSATGVIIIKVADQTVKVVK